MTEYSSKLIDANNNLSFIYAYTSTTDISNTDISNNISYYSQIYGVSGEKYLYGLDKSGIPFIGYNHNDNKLMFYDKNDDIINANLNQKLKNLDGTASINNNIDIDNTLLVSANPFNGNNTYNII